MPSGDTGPMAGVYRPFVFSPISGRHRETLKFRMPVFFKWSGSDDDEGPSRVRLIAPWRAR